MDSFDSDIAKRISGMNKKRTQNTNEKLFVSDHPTTNKRTRMDRVESRTDEEVEDTSTKNVTSQSNPYVLLEIVSTYFRPVIYYHTSFT